MSASIGGYRMVGGMMTPAAFVARDYGIPGVDSRNNHAVCGAENSTKFWIG